MTIDNNENKLLNLMKRVRDEQNRKADYIVPANHMQKRTIEDSNGKMKPQLIVEQRGGEPTLVMDFNDVSFNQYAVYNGIESRTARRLQDQAPSEFDALLNRLHSQDSNKRMLRTFDNGSSSTLRANLSDKFKTFDNYDFLEASIPALLDRTEEAPEIMQADYTEKRMYMRFKFNAQTGEGANVGDLMANGIGFSNSETGHGSIAVWQNFWTLACTNGMQTDNRSRSAHITSARESDVYGVLSQEAKDADNKAMALKLRDLEKSYSSRESFDEVLQKMRLAGADVAEDIEPVELANNAGRVLALTKQETSGLLNGLISTIGQAGYERDKPLTRATLINAVTACQHKAEKDDVDLWQRRGGQVLNMRASDWSRIKEKKEKAVA